MCSNLWLHLFDHRGCLFVIVCVGAISLVSFSSGAFSRVPFDWVPFRSVRFHRHSCCVAYIFSISRLRRVQALLEENVDENSEQIDSLLCVSGTMVVINAY